MSKFWPQRRRQPPVSPADYIPPFDTDLDPEGPGEHDRHLTDHGKACPECGEDAFIDDDVCRQCGHFFMDDVPPSPSPVRLWVTLGVLLLFAFPVLYKAWRLLVP